ncbi:MAG: metal-dependent hydrolase [Actinomycetota bacterium]
MFFFAHLGFTAAPAALVSTWWGENRGFVSRAPDLRWLLAGAVLPDIIDKAVGEVLFKPHFENGRIFAHTFALSLLLLVAGTYGLKRRGDSRILLLACGVAGHLVLDRIWTEAATAWWPAMGPFLRYPSQGTIIEQILEYLRDPMFWSTEIAGAALLVISLRYLGVKNWRTLKGFVVSGVSPSLTPFAFPRGCT